MNKHKPNHPKYRKYAGALSNEEMWACVQSVIDKYGEELDKNCCEILKQEFESFNVEDPLSLNKVISILKEKGWIE